MSVLRNQVQLITYPDSLGRNLQELKFVLDRYLRGAVGGVHILPFYPSSADRGYAPLTQLVVDHTFGTWNDVRAIAAQYDLVADLSINHLSSESTYFNDFIAKGDASAYAELFLDVDRFLARHHTSIEALKNTYRPRPTPPYTSFQCKDGTVRRMWTTFTAHQIDLDHSSEITCTLMESFIKKLVDNGVRLIRLDAAGYTVKQPWTTSFLIPETYEFIRWVRTEVPNNVDVLAEAHHRYLRHDPLLQEFTVDWVYDFVLPFLMLYTLYTGHGALLKHWISIRSPRQITVLDTHDGIGVVDVEGLMHPEDVDGTIRTLMQHGGNQLFRASGRHSENLDLYQINCTYFSALGNNDDAYIAARAIQFFMPGIPQVYYVGLLAGSNDFETFEHTNQGRDINRHNFPLAAVADEMRRPVVRRLLRLMRLRSTHPAFEGKFALLDSSESLLQMRWCIDDLYCEARVNLRTYGVTVEQVNPQNGRVEITTY